MHPADQHALIRVHGARENNLRDVSVELPKRRLTVFTGVSGSGKSSLVFATIAAESQRLINETYSAFVQGFLPTLSRPDVDLLDGLTTAIVVDQAVAAARSLSRGPGGGAAGFLNATLRRFGRDRDALLAAIADDPVARHDHPDWWLARLRDADTSPRPPGWNLSLHAVRRFILGDAALGIQQKFVGNPSLVDRAMVTLATNRGLMLVGEPGTAKSLLSELLAGESGLISLVGERDLWLITPFLVGGALLLAVLTAWTALRRHVRV